MTVPAKSSSTVAFDPDRWRSRADGPRWLYARPGRLRAPWRLAAFVVALTVCQPIAESFITPLFGALSQMVGEPLVAYPWTTLVAVAASLIIALRVVDEAPWSAVALGAGAWRPRTLLVGLAVGSAAITVTMALLFVTGTARLEFASASGALSAGDSWGSTALRLTALLAPAALWEEMMFRGYLWTVAEDAGGVRVARWSTACAFGVVHVLNPGAAVLSTILVVSAGYCLGVLREHTGSLPAVWFAHLAWNWIMAVALHVPVSGVAFDAPAYRTVVSGPDWWTGGTWGPEGGAAALLVMCGALALSMRPAAGWRSFRMEKTSR